MWTSLVRTLEDGRSRQVSVLSDGIALSYSKVLELWRFSEAFRDFYISLLADTRLAAYFWETPPVSPAKRDPDFEFVQLDSPVLARVNADPSAFREHFDASPKQAPVVRFANLGHDAELLVPRPLAGNPAYPQLAAFTDLAPRAQQHALWQMAGIAMQESPADRTTWLSTSGLGVHWVHLRLDSTPKYYQFEDYRNQGTV